MLNPDEKKLLAKGMLNIQIIWGAMLFSLVIYLLVCHLFINNLPSEISSNFPLALFKNILLFISAVTLLTAVVMRRIMLTVKRGQSPMRSHQHTPAQYHPAVAKYMSAIIVSLALSESIGIYGFVIHFLSRDFHSLYIFLVISAFAMIYFRPRMDELTNLANAMKETG
jgi:F0F1-type ATP synthase membrane subunit c/vacuolar-type H+-ATPase subunit K